MTISMPTATVEGIQLTVTAFRPDAVIGTIGLPTLLQLVPSPKAEEDKRALSTRPVRCAATLRCAPWCSAC